MLHCVVCGQACVTSNHSPRIKSSILWQWQGLVVLLLEVTNWERKQLTYCTLYLGKFVYALIHWLGSFAGDFLISGIWKWRSCFSNMSSFHAGICSQREQMTVYCFCYWFGLLTRWSVLVSVSVQPGYIELNPLNWRRQLLFVNIIQNLEFELYRVGLILMERSFMWIIRLQALVIS